MAAEIYGITIYVHTHHSVQVYEFEHDCPPIHLIKLKSKDGFYVYLGTEKTITNKDEKHDIDHINEGDIKISNSVSDKIKD